MPNYELGSIWRKWDLHIHSPLSGLNNQFPKLDDGTPDWESYITALEGVADVPVLGMTDYFLVDGYRTVREYKRNGRLQNIDLILPNIEFRIDKVLLAKQRRLTMHVVFSDALTPEAIEDKFLSNLDVVMEGAPGSRDDRRKLRRGSLVDLGAHLKAEHPPFRDRTDYEVGCAQAVVSLDQIIDLLTSDQSLRDLYLIGLADEDVSLMSWDAQDHNVRKLLLQRSHFVFTGNPKSIDWNLGHTYPSVEEFVAEFKSQKPSLFGSDAHDLAHLCKPPNNKQTWIKADTTFEGLRQITYEPELRVHIGSSPPNEKDDSKVISSLSVAGSSGWFEDRTLALNRDLVAVIGGKGSGKTALLDLISIAADAIDTTNTASFLTKASHEVKGTTVTISWGDGATTTRTVPDRIGPTANQPRVRYLSQSFVESLCSYDQQEKLLSQIESILFQYVPVPQQLGAKDFGTLKRLKTQAIQIEIDTANERLRQTNKQIFETEQGIAEKHALNADRGKLIADRESLERQRPAAASDEERAVRERLQDLHKREAQIERTIEEWNVKLGVIAQLRANANRLYQEIQRFNEEVAETVRRHDLPMDVAAISAVAPEHATVNFDAAAEFCTRESQKLQTEDGDPDLLDTLPKVLAAIRPLESLVSSEVEKQKQLQEIEKRITELNRRLQTTDAAIARIDTELVPLVARLRATRAELFTALWVGLEAKRAALEDLYRPLSDAVKDKGERGKVSFHTRLVFRVGRFAADGWVLLDGRRTAIRGEQDLAEIGNQLWAALSREGNQDKNAALATLLSSLEKATPIQDQLRKNFTMLDVYNWLYSGNYYDVEYGIRYEGTELDKLSPGRKGVVLLLIYLDFDQDFRPLIVDQPEENLDNRSVFGTLVEYFRSAKKRRQVIMVTHNPNLVVNTDAEQVIVANFEPDATTQAKRIAYAAGALEQSHHKDTTTTNVLLQQGIREHVCELLEGGDIAFLKREHRYGLF